MIQEKDSIPGSSVITISSARECLELSTVTYAKKKVEQIPAHERQRRRLFGDVLADLGFFLQQRLDPIREDGPGTLRDHYINEKIDGLLAFIEDDLKRNRELLYNHLETDNPAILTAVVFVLSSVECHQESSSCLNKVLAGFSRGNEEQLTCYINGLSKGRHPQLTNSLTLLRELALPDIKEACTEIIRSRNRNE